MLTFFITFFIFLVILIFLNSLSKITNKIDSLYINGREHKRQLDERITDLRDHVRRTETAIFKTIDDKTHHMSDPVARTKLDTLQKEIEHLNSLILKLVIITDAEKPAKPKKKQS